MINGVLVERTVKEVVPALKTNSEGLKKVLDELVVQYKSKQDEMEKWKVCYISSLLRIAGHVLTANRKRIMFRSYSSNEVACFLTSHDFLALPSPNQKKMHPKYAICTWGEIDLIKVYFHF
jgi:Prefoldin subunit